MIENDLGLFSLSTSVLNFVERGGYVYVQYFIFPSKTLKKTNESHELLYDKIK